MSARTLNVDAELERLQCESFNYFLHETNPANGLVRDKSAADWPASIAATGLALAAYPVGVERGFMTRAGAVERTLATLRFFWNSPQGPEPDATGYHGFYYHFLDMQTGRRAWKCELSTVDSAFLLAGALTAGIYFDADTADEREIRTLADALYRRADWQWAQNQGATVTHGWKPESGFLKYRWEGYDEALLLYTLGLGSPTHPPAREQLRGVGFHLPVGKMLRPRISLRRAIVHPPALACLDRLSRDSGRFHARKRHRLFREQPPCDLRATTVRDRQPTQIRGLCFMLLGNHCKRGTRS